MRNLGLLNFTTSPSEKTSVARIEAGPATDLKALSKAICMNWGDFCLLNRHHRAYITSAAQPTYIYVPEEKKLEARHLAMMTGITPANISRIEQGKHSVGIDILSKIADVLGYKVELVKK